MFCPKCGNILADNAKFCSACGASVEPAKSGYTSYQQQTTYQQTSSAQANPQVGFVDAVKLFYRKYADFNGRSRRSEYWWVVLFTSLVSAVLGTLEIGWLEYLWGLVILVPNLALMVRRLHDVGKSWTWLLFNLIPLAGPIIMLVQFCKDSDPGANQWGVSPKYVR